MAQQPTGDDAARLRAQAQAFADLITRTRDGLQAVGVPAQLAGAIDAVLPDWEKTDPDFAAVLTNLKGQAWQMQGEHLRAVREKLVQHLDANLAHVKKQLA